MKAWRPPRSERRLLQGVILEINGVATVDRGELEKREAAERRYWKRMREFRAIQKQLKGK